MNPILQALQNKGGQRNNVGSIISALRSGNANELYEQMLRTNPQFEKFVKDNRGKTPDQIASAYGIDINTVLNRFGAQIRSK